MTNFELPLRNDLPSFSYTVDLEGGQFILGYNFNERMGMWLFTISTVSDETILSNVPMIANRPLTDRFVIPGLPRGQFIAFDTSGTDTDPGRFDLGDRVTMVYRV